jgi:hypothetical protein
VSLLNGTPRSMRTSRPGAPVARSWGSGLRRRGPATTLLLVLALAGCAGPVASSPPSAAASTPASSTAAPTPAPSASSIPAAPSTLSPPALSPGTSASFVALPIGTAEAAIAAVVAIAPQFAGFGPERPGQVGESSHVVVATVDTGWQLTFVTGSGDCMAGCIEHAYAKYAVARTGKVSLQCEWSTDAGTVVKGRSC